MGGGSQTEHLAHSKSLTRGAIVSLPRKGKRKRLADREMAQYVDITSPYDRAVFCRSPASLPWAFPVV